MHQRARQVVDVLQRQRRDHEIERSVAERQRFLVGGDGEAAVARRAIRVRIDGDHDADRARARQRGPHRFARGAEIGRDLEAAQHRGVAVRQIVRRPIQQKRRRPLRHGAAQPLPQQGAVEDDRTCGFMVCVLGHALFGDALFDRLLCPIVSRRRIAVPARSALPTWVPMTWPSWALA